MGTLTETFVGGEGYQFPESPPTKEDPPEVKLYFLLAGKVWTGEGGLLEKAPLPKRRPTQSEKDAFEAEAASWRAKRREVVVVLAKEHRGLVEEVLALDPRRWDDLERYWGKNLLVLLRKEMGK